MYNFFLKNLFKNCANLTYIVQVVSEMMAFIHQNCVYSSLRPKSSYIIGFLSLPLKPLAKFFSSKFSFNNYAGELISLRIMSLKLCLQFCTSSCVGFSLLMISLQIFISTVIICLTSQNNATTEKVPSALSDRKTIQEKRIGHLSL